MTLFPSSRPRSRILPTTTACPSGIAGPTNVPQTQQASVPNPLTTFCEGHEHGLVALNGDTFPCSDDTTCTPHAEEIPHTQFNGAYIAFPTQ